MTLDRHELCVRAAHKLSDAEVALVRANALFGLLARAIASGENESDWVSLADVGEEVTRVYAARCGEESDFFNGEAQ